MNHDATHVLLFVFSLSFFCGVYCCSMFDRLTSMLIGENSKGMPIKSHANIIHPNYDDEDDTYDHDDDGDDEDD